MKRLARRIMWRWHQRRHPPVARVCERIGEWTR